MMAGLSPEQRAELADLMAQTMQDMGLASEMAHLQDALRQARPDLPWGQRGQVPDGEQSLGMGDATTAVAELARSEEHTSELQSRQYLVCRLLLEKINFTLASSRCQFYSQVYRRIELQRPAINSFSSCCFFAFFHFSGFVPTADVSPVQTSLECTP